MFSNKGRFAPAFFHALDIRAGGPYDSCVNYMGGPMPYGLENKFNARAQAAMDAYNRNDFAGFSAAVKGLDPAYLPGLLEYVCSFPRSERTLAPASRLTVALEALAFGVTRTEVRARHDWLRAANTDVEVSGAVDAILASGPVDKSALETALAITEKRGYAAASRSLRFKLQHN